MIGNGQSVLAVIPARGGSKGLPRKNVLPLGGRPLIHWSVQAARSVSRIDRVAVSSDDDEILSAAKSAGCHDALKRPDALAGDDVTTEPVLLQAAAALGGGFDWILLLQPTSPFRMTADIDAVLDIAAKDECDAVVTVCEPSKSPFWSFTMDGRDGSLRFLMGDRPNSQRQHVAKAYAPNGAVYCGRPQLLQETGSFYGGALRGHVMPPERSVDIDTELDLIYAQFLVDRGIVALPGQ